MNTMPFDPGPPVDVDCEPSGDRWTLVFVRDFRHPPDKVWAALTEPAPFVTDRPLDRTGDATLTMIDGDGERSGDLPATVVCAEPPVLLEYTWGADLLRWDLVPTAAGTRLTLRHTLQDQDWVPKVAAGWHICLAVAERLIDGQPVGPIVGERARDYGWDELADTYAKTLGITGEQS